MADKRALIVDDDYANRSIWELVLTDRGYEVLSASDMAEGSTLVAEGISLYLIDYHLPDGRGTDIVKQVKEHFPDSLIVMVSMDDDADVIREAMLSGGNIFIVKPASAAMMNQLLVEIDNGEVDQRTRQLINRNGRRTYGV